MELVKTFTFDAAHSLPAAPNGHKCKRIHGHSYRVDIHVSGEVDRQRGWLMDFGDLKCLVAPIIDELDHRNLDELDDLPNSTSEMLAKYIWDRLLPSLSALSAVTVWESASSRCIYRGV
ncbi:MAG: 6-carboxytetrahydropterin synthase QueD [Planctomycetes bacterium]|nr:6-carboxytetrahydropterin synthase QueD [Phycisphaerae bacterium]NBB96473.1 6-carboxytetrahydropterin synthase QueD [Planctomycetota bacterium]